LLAQESNSFTRSVVGTLITHSWLRRIISKLWLALEMQQATSDGENSNTMCQPMVMMLVFSFHAELTSTTGPGSK
jgi:hypothetical protein